MPDLVGLLRATAESRVSVAGLSLWKVEETFSETVASGRVISQLPSAGREVDEGTRVTLTISKGPQTTTVPDTVGQSRTAAELAIENAGLVASVTEQFSSTVAAGLVISQSPNGGSSASPGATVSLVVSLGSSSGSGGGCAGSGMKAPVGYADAILMLMVGLVLWVGAQRQARRAATRSRKDTITSK